MSPRRHEVAIAMTWEGALCHNLSVLVHAIHELGIEPAFWSRMETA
jgi:hypothetical protein